MKPSDFMKKHPYNSIFQNSECETIARNIMVILSDTGDSFRKIELFEYEERRLKDGNYSIKEKQLFNKVNEYCVSEEMAQKFSKNW